MTLTELLECKGPNEEKIVDYLLKYTQENNWNKIVETQKPFSDCMNFITELARKAAVNRIAMISEEQVYQWALDFYNEAKPAEVPMPEKQKRKAVKQKKDDSYEEVTLF